MGCSVEDKREERKRHWLAKGRGREAGRAEKCKLMDL